MSPPNVRDYYQRVFARYDELSDHRSTAIHLALPPGVLGAAGGDTLDAAQVRTEDD